MGIYFWNPLFSFFFHLPLKNKSFPWPLHHLHTSVACPRHASPLSKRIWLHMTGFSRECMNLKPFLENTHKLFDTIDWCIRQDAGQRIGSKMIKLLACCLLDRRPSNNWGGYIIIMKSLFVWIYILINGNRLLRLYFGDYIS